MKTTIRKNYLPLHVLCQVIKVAFLFTFLLIWNNLSGQTQKDASPVGDDDKLLDEFLKSKGYTHAIVFDASNIKQYWADKSVFSKDKIINVLLNNNNVGGYESNPLKFQLKNVNERQDCKVEIISKSSDVNFSIADSKSKVLATSSDEDNFIQNHVASS